MTKIKTVKKAMKKGILYPVHVRFENDVTYGIDREYYFVGLATSREKGYEMAEEFAATYGNGREYYAEVTSYYLENVNDFCGHEFIEQSRYLE